MYFTSQTAACGMNSNALERRVAHTAVAIISTITFSKAFIPKVEAYV